MLIATAEADLREGGRAAMADQVAAIGRFQRLNAGRMVLVLDRNGRRMAGYDGKDDCLYSGRIKDGAGISVVGRVFAYAGGPHRLEFTPSPRGLEEASLSIRSVRSRGPAKSIAAEIDREEHDDSYDGPDKKAARSLGADERTRTSTPRGAGT
jgi:hypothetical protein